MIDDETELLSQVSDPAAGLFPSYSNAAENTKSFVGHFTGDFSLISDSAIQILLSSGFFKTLEKEAQIKQGDIQNIVGKFVKLEGITLTNKNILLLCKKQWRSKEHKLITLPLKYATDVRLDEGRKRVAKTEEGKLGIEKDSVYVTFKVSQKGEDELGCFNLGLSVDNPSLWSKSIERVIGLDMLKIAGPEKICANVDIGVKGIRSVCELCFTQERILVSKLWNKLPVGQIVLLASLAAIGILLALFSVLSVLPALAYNQFYPETALWLTSGIIMISISFGSARFLKSRKLKKMLEASPESILEKDKDSFEIPYGDIVQVRVIRKGFGSKQFGGKVADMDILTESKKHEFFFGSEMQLTDFLRFVNRVLPERKIMLK